MKMILTYQHLQISKGQGSRGWSQALLSSAQWEYRGHKLERRKFCLNTKQNFLTVRVTRHWNKLPREVMQSSFLEIFRTCLDSFCVTYCREHTLAGGWTSDLEVTFPSPMILWFCGLVSHFRHFYLLYLGKRCYLSTPVASCVWWASEGANRLMPNQERFCELFAFLLLSSPNLAEL